MLSTSVKSVRSHSESDVDVSVEGMASLVGYQQPSLSSRWFTVEVNLEIPVR